MNRDEYDWSTDTFRIIKKDFTREDIVKALEDLEFLKVKFERVLKNSD